MVVALKILEFKVNLCKSIIIVTNFIISLFCFLFVFYQILKFEDGFQNENDFPWETRISSEFFNSIQHRNQERESTVVACGRKENALMQ